jgi:spore coat polysaccharide biosynthesis protein SpsF
MNKIAIIQARMSSSRLPGKVLMDIAGRPLLEHEIMRTMKARSIDAIVVATTTDPSDDILEQYCLSTGVPCYRGSLPDVLDRMYHAAVQFHADVIIRLTGDCPLIDPDVIDRTVSIFLGNYRTVADSAELLRTNNASPLPDPFDFAANRLPPPWNRTLPIGLDVEVCSFDALERAWKEADQAYQREHVMPYLYEGITLEQTDPAQSEWYIEQGTTPRDFRIALLNHQPDYGSMRWTVDTLADLEFARQIYSHLAGQASFSWQEILTLLETEPDLADINIEVQPKSAFDIDQRTPHS